MRAHERLIAKSGLGPLRPVAEAIAGPMFVIRTGRPVAAEGDDFRSEGCRHGSRA